jgi:hypothetical protein
MDAGQALILIDHPGIDRDEVWSVFERRWPKVVMRVVGDIQPSSRMTVEDAAALARCRRGIEPIRIVILPQVAATAGPPSSQPMAMLI